LDVKKFGAGFRTMHTRSDEKMDVSFIEPKTLSIECSEIEINTCGKGTDLCKKLVKHVDCKDMGGLLLVACSEKGVKGDFEAKNASSRPDFELKKVLSFIPQGKTVKHDFVQTNTTTIAHGVLHGKEAFVGARTSIITSPDQCYIVTAEVTDIGAEGVDGKAQPQMAQAIATQVCKLEKYISLLTFAVLAQQDQCKPKKSN